MKQRLVIGAAVAAIAVGLAGCGKKQEPAPAPGPSASSVALEPLIQQYADLERKDEDDESGGLRDVSLDGFKKEIDTRRQLLEKIQQVEASRPVARGRYRSPPDDRAARIDDPHGGGAPHVGERRVAVRARR